MELTRIAEALKAGRVEDVKTYTEMALSVGKEPKEIINSGLMAGMNVVGEKFKNGEMFVPEVLIASKAMNAGMEIIKPLLKEGDVTSKGKAVFATVKGDLHDIGKKLVCMMMESSGYEVVDLGVDASPEKIIEAVKEHDADIVGMSAMLTTTMMAMKNTVEGLKENGLYDDVKVMIGGAPVTDNYAEEIGANYSSDSTEAVELANRLMA
ncbi:5-methyltetrahydrofolate--homocysteine methyltransferase [Dethiosulfatibacter aminovorans DSM 17477]|uniref:5-methyltetrahydrofolate--homocysteine methyltransferase n=1 Tax=Dethiosulfatibacter aminovorans DSM 17477 TaxID=1121476 RepID=A0A1M6GTM2_9FIRM|nr:corrinoid protein [Dethiosulfatibacter aminovorans]SHJ13324.1 5-methyltetrahydrofolate--homocysteine methyltransferase [Dethiosulfatibacter aminovorans DSM 17477]